MAGLRCHVAPVPESLAPWADARREIPIPPTLAQVQGYGVDVFC
jgi:hypothetical protein